MIKTKRVGKITSDIIVEVKATRDRYPALRHQDIAKLCGLGESTVGFILQGKYDEKMVGKIKEPEQTTMTIVPESKADKLKKLLCEIVDVLFAE